MATILVTGIGGPAGRNTTRLLLDRGHQVVGTDIRPIDIDGGSFHIVPPFNAPDFLDSIYSLSASMSIDLLIPTVSEELPLVAAARHRWTSIPVVIGPFEAVTIANDKYLTSRRLLNCGVKAPRFMLPSEAKTRENIDEQLGWPCLSKPRVGRGGRGVTVYSKADWPAINRLDDNYILQEFIPGTDYAPNVYVNGENPIVVVLEKTLLKEGIVGNALEVRRVEAPDVAEVAIAAGRALGFSGPIDVDVRRRADGTPVVLEINARFGANILHAPEILDATLTAYTIIA